MGVLVRYVLIYMRLVLGAWMLLNGLNHFMFVFPQPMGNTQGAAELLTVLISTGLFDIVKLTEIVIGLMLLLDWFVPLALVMSLPISTVILYNHAILGEKGLDFAMGNGCFFFTLALMAAYLPYYLPLLSWRTEMGRLGDFRRLPEILSPKVDVAPESRHRLLILIAAVIVTLVLYFRIHPRAELPPGLGKLPAAVAREYLELAYAQGQRAQAEKLYFSADAISASSSLAFPVDGQPMRHTIVDIVAQGHKVTVHHRVSDAAQSPPIDIVEFFETDRAGIIVSRSALVPASASVR